MQNKRYVANYYNESGRIKPYEKIDSLVAKKIYGYLEDKTVNGEKILLPTSLEVLEVFNQSDSMIKSRGCGIELKYDDYFGRVILEYFKPKVNNYGDVLYSIEVKDGEINKFAKIITNASSSKKINLEETPIYDEAKVTELCNLLSAVEKDYHESKTKTM